MQALIVKKVLPLRLQNPGPYMAAMVRTLHPDSSAIDRVGTTPIVEHFQVTKQAVSYWRRAGIPKQHRRPLALLGKVQGHDMSDLA